MEKTTVRAAAKEFGVDRRTMYNWIKKGRINAEIVVENGKNKIQFICKDETYEELLKES